jgi:hypothetical protein
MFDVAVAVKAFNGVLEIAGVEHPANWFAQMIEGWIYGLTVDTERFANPYLIARSIANRSVR